MDTPRYRIGNDITIFWAINNRDGSPYDLDGKEVRLFVTNDRGREEVEVEITKLTDTIRNNVLRWDFKAEDQRILGKYTLTLAVLETDTHRELIKDYAEAFTLVSRSEMENEEGDANISTGGDLILASKLDIYRIQATNVDVAGLKNQIYDVEKGLTTKVERKEFDEKTGEFENAFVKVETSIKGINTEIKDASGEITQIKQSIDGIEVSVGDLEYKVESLEKQTDGAIEKWFYPGPPSAETLPESNWKTEQEKYSHLGDLYYDEDSGIAYRYITKDNLYLWVVIEDADIVAALEAAKNNNRTFIDQPKAPYKVGDLWIAEKDYPESGIEADDIVVCINTREEGQFDITDWQKKGNAINDKDLESFVENYYKDTILPEINKQVDQMAAAHYGADDPSLEWEEGTEAEHAGDLWYNTNTGRAYYWSGTAWVESDVPEEVFDKIDGKNSIFVSIPKGKPYRKNDLWFVEQDYNAEGFKHNKGEILVALEDAVYNEVTDAYTFLYSDWVKRDSYTDDTAVKELDDYIHKGFKDGILDESEKKTIKSAWDNIVLAQEQLNADYLTVILPGYTTDEFKSFQRAFKAVYNEEPSDEYPNLGAYQNLELRVNEILNYNVPEEDSNLETLVEAYDEAYDAYRRALSNYSTAYAEFVNAIRADLGQANEYIEAIIDDGKLTPIEKKQLVEVYKSLAAEYSSNVDAAFTAKIWKYNDAGNEVPGVYAGPKGVGQDYFDTYVAYKDAYSPILAVFTGSDWGFDKDKMDETTTFGGSVNLSQLDAYFDAYYEALRAIARVISAVAEEKAEASLAMKEYMDDLEEVLTPTEAITQVDKGVVLSSVIGVGTYDEQSGKYLLKAGMNATAKNTADLITVGEHGRIVFVGGANGKKDWNQATYVVYEDGYVHFRAGKIDQDVQIGEAVIQAVIADQINLLSWPEYDEATGQTKLTPLFSVNTEKDSNGRDKIVSISALYDMYVGGNLVVRGDTSTGGTGSNPEVAGTLIGINFNGVEYKDATNGILTIPNRYYTTEEVDAKIAGVDVSGQLAGYQPLITANSKLDYSLLKNTPTIPTNTNQLTNGAGFITSASLPTIYSLTLKKADGTTLVAFDPEEENKSVTLDKAVVGLANVENKSSATIRGEITAINVTNALGYTPLSTAGGTISNASYAPFGLRNTETGADAVGIAFRIKDAGIAYMLHRGGDQWELISENWATQRTIIHSGNIGSYAPIYNSSGNVLIGTTDDDGSKLQVGGIIIAKVKTSTSHIMAANNNGTVGLQVANNGNRGLYDYTTSKWLCYYNGSNLIVPEAVTMSSTLSIGGVLAINGMDILYSNGSSTAYFGNEAVNSYVSGNNVYLRYGANAATGLILNSSGNVTIGASDTAGTNYRFYVSTGKSLIYAWNNTAMSLGSAQPNSLLVGADVGLGMWYQSGVGSVLQSERFDGTATAYNLSLQPLGGNVLIGTTTDDESGAKLQVDGGRITIKNGTSKNYSYIRTENYSSNTARMVIGTCYGYGSEADAIRIYNKDTTLLGAVTMSSTLSVGDALTISSGRDGKLIFNNTDGEKYTEIRFQENGSNYNAWIISDSGCNLGYKPVVIGNTLTVSGQTTINNNLIVAGDTSSGSDIRFKDKLSDHRIALSDIAEAPLFTFKWNDREDDSVHLGTSAQYWEKVAPWLVKGDDFKTLDYSTLGVAIGISLANKTMNHEERIKILEKENKALKEQIRRIQYGQLG